MHKPAQGNDRAAALDALDDDQKKQLAAYARVMSGGTEFTGSELLHEAVVRWMKSDKPEVGSKQTCDFLRGAINSVRSNWFRRQKIIRRFEGERAFRQEEDDEEPLDQASDPAASTEGPLYVQQVYDVCDDEEIRLLLTAQADNATPDQVKEEFGWDDRKYEAVRKRKRRLVIRLMREGKLL